MDTPVHDPPEDITVYMDIPVLAMLTQADSSHLGALKIICFNGDHELKAERPRILTSLLTAP